MSQDPIKHQLAERAARLSQAQPESGQRRHTRPRGRPSAVALIVTCAFLVPIIAALAFWVLMAR